MPETTRKRQPSKKKAEQPRDEIGAVVDAEAERLKAEADALLDEIDAVLEGNAEEFVNHYVQKGGE